MAEVPGPVKDTGEPGRGEVHKAGRKLITPLPTDMVSAVPISAEGSRKW